jgi:general secretion pathway protein C
VRRNPFDHATKLGPAEPDPAPSGPVDPASAPPCEGVRVVAIAASSDPDWSFAAIGPAGKDGANGELKRRGDEIGSKVIAFVGWDRVWLAEKGAVCQAALFRGPEKPATTPPTPAKPQVAGASLPADVARGIRRLSPNEFEVDRATLDRVLDGQQQLLMQTRVVPDTIDGRIAGLRLVGVKPDSLLGAVGLLDGDRLEAINGLDITTPEKALEAYARVRTGEKFSVRLTRGGAPMTIDYAVR